MTKGTGTTGRRQRAGRTAAEVDAWCARFDAVCRARGLRRTVQRAAVCRAVASDPGHPTAGAVREPPQPRRWPETRIPGILDPDRERSDPMGGRFDYAAQFRNLDFVAAWTRVTGLDRFGQGSR
ncbi:MAG TPA: hypothetical protein VFS92_08270 [Planctomycetota bacterium]|nr:hypothetical protein [Planctomycetota bacterium]